MSRAVEQDDSLLIEHALEGDDASFGHLVSKYQDRLFNTLFHSLGCREEAEDVAQEAFVAAFVKLSTFKQNSAFYTWLYRIAFNTAISRRRKKRPKTSVDSQKELTGAEPIDPSDSPDGALERTERVAQVQTALSQLGDEQRSILVLREMDDCSYEQIADILEIPVGTVRSRLHRARAQLREELTKILQPNEST